MRTRFIVTALLTLALEAQTPPPAASNNVQVQVPASMRSAPFNVSRTLTVPPGFVISVYARVPWARFMAVAPNGDVLVSNPGAGRIYLLRRNTSGHADVSVFASGLRNPHDLVFATLAGTTWLYVAESHQIVRYVYRSGDAVISSGNPIVTGLPDSSSPELRGAYGHQLKNIAIGADGKLYVSIASATNASIADAISDPVRSAIYQYNADGTGRRLFARGLRNAEGLAFVPGTSTLWVTVNGRDNTPVPMHRDWDGDGTDDYGKFLTTYVDNHPPEPFTRVMDGANYGWPYANPTPDSPNGLTNMPFDPDYDNNRDWTRFPESTFTRISKGIQAHSAPLGFSFLQNSMAPAAYRNGAAIALHGSWNRSRKVGYKVIYFPWRSDGTPGDEMDLVRGWLDESTQSAWGRPVDVVPDATGGLLISDDASGTIYKLTSTQPTASGPEVISLSPTSGSGTSGTFTAVFRHPNGAPTPATQGHYLGYILFLPMPNVVSFNAQGTCLIEYNRISNGMRLINNAGNGWIGPPEGVPVAASTAPLSNNACTVNVAGSSAVLSGTDMTVTVPVTFHAANVTTTMGTFIQANDVDDNWTDFRQFGNWSVPGAPLKAGPNVLTTTPTSGTGSSMVLNTTIRHSGGASQIGEVHIRFNTGVVGGAPCHAVYFGPTNTLALINDAGTALVGPVALGNPISTGRCNLAGGATRSISGENLVLNLSFTFSAANFAGAKNTYINAFDLYGAVTHWVRIGSWTVQ